MRGAELNDKRAPPKSAVPFYLGKIKTPHNRDESNPIPLKIRRAQRSLGTVVSPAKINSSISTGTEKRTFIVITSLSFFLCIIAINVRFVKGYL